MKLKIVSVSHITQMNDLIDRLDVLVVYSHKIATSASLNILSNKVPFSRKSGREKYNHSYAYLLKTCEQNHLKAGFTTSADVIGPGLCKSYWIYKDNQWFKINNKVSANVIFDKFSPTNDISKKAYQMLFSNHNITPFNDPYLYRLFFDKLKTFRRFEHASIPTIAIKDSKAKNITIAMTQLKLLVQKTSQEDFGDGVILKNRGGSGGYDIYKIDKDIKKSIEKIMNIQKNLSFIIQPIILFDKGYVYKNMNKAVDIRIIFMGKKIIQSYIRIAKKNDFRCNEHQGGQLVYIDIKDLPTDLTSKAISLATRLNKPNSLFALDFIIGNSGRIYFLEGNCNPGLDWNLKIKRNEIKSKELMQSIVAELKIRVNKTFSRYAIAETEIINVHPTTPNLYNHLLDE